MDSASATSHSAEPSQPQPVPQEPSSAELQRRTELIIDGLRAALAEAADHRLFRSGKLPGLFPSRTGVASQAALFAIREGLIETVRAETRGRMITEWVRPTARGMNYLHEHDSPKAVLLDLQAAIGTTRDGVPIWMAEAKTEVALLSERFEHRARAMIAQLDELTKRVEAALRRVELSKPALPERTTKNVPWGEAALVYLDTRAFSGIASPCPLAELFQGVLANHATLSIPEFHAGLRRLHELRALRLVSGITQDAEFALQIGAGFCSFAAR